MNLLDTVEDWVFHKALGRAAFAVGKAAAAYALAHSGALEHWGVTVSLDPNMVAAGLLGAAHVGSDWLSFHFPRFFGWMHNRV